MTDRPPLSVVIPTRDGAVDDAVDAVLREVRCVGGEVIVVDGRDGRHGRVDGDLRWVRVGDPRMPSLRAVGVKLARGEVIAIGEDHALPAPGWARAVVDAHDRRPDADAIVGCLVNATDRTLAGRANFLAFAAAWVPPLDELPPHRPPPASTLSFKRRVLAELGDGPGDLDAVLIPRLFNERRMAADGSVVVLHHQDHGLPWSIVNAYRSARSGYGYGYGGRGAVNHAAAKSALVGVPRQLWGEARRATAAGDRRPTSVVDLAAVGVIALAAGVGAASGVLRGPGRAPDKVA